MMRLVSLLLLLLLPLLSDGLYMTSSMGGRSQTRRRFMLTTFSTSAVLLPAPPTPALADDDEVDENDEIPDIRSGRVAPKASKSGGGGSSKKAAKVSSAVGVEAAEAVVRAQGAVKKAVKLATDKDWVALGTLLDDPVLTGFEDAITKVSNAEGLLSAEDRVAIGTIRRYGLAADYMITIGGVSAELKSSNSKEVLRLLKLANNSIDEIVQILRSARVVSKQ